MKRMPLHIAERRQKYGDPPTDREAWRIPARRTDRDPRSWSSRRSDATDKDTDEDCRVETCEVAGKPVTNVNC
ncbi:hypothetical protein GCM10009668_00090 [Nocardioides dubius]|uniref:Uncharacterized protein n=1 Tax=Nocardioides dubius TaxID=317019 RepID=A0ABP4E5W9_9ACTN